MSNNGRKGYMSHTNTFVHQGKCRNDHNRKLAQEEAEETHTNKEGLHVDPGPMLLFKSNSDSLVPRGKCHNDDHHKLAQEEAAQETHTDSEGLLDLVLLLSDSDNPV